MKKDSLIQIRVEPEVKKKLQEAAIANHRNLSDFVRQSAVHVADKKIKV